MTNTSTLQHQLQTLVSGRKGYLTRSLPSARKNHASSPPRYQGTGSGFDYKQMETSIDQMVAECLMHGRQTSSVLRALFGIIPSLIGR
jgi:hypothetical protein